MGKDIREIGASLVEELSEGPLAALNWDDVIPCMSESLTGS